MAGCIARLNGVNNLSRITPVALCLSARSRSAKCCAVLRGAALDGRPHRTARGVRPVSAEAYDWLAHRLTAVARTRYPTRVRRQVPLQVPQVRVEPRGTRMHSLGSGEVRLSGGAPCLARSDLTGLFAPRDTIQSENGTAAWRRTGSGWPMVAAHELPAAGCSRGS